MAYDVQDQKNPTIPEIIYKKFDDFVN